MARSGQRQKQQRTTAQKATADGLCSALFVFLFAWLDEPALWVAPSLGLSQAGAKMALVLLLLIAMGPVAQAMGGALFNPANNAFVYARGDGSVWEHLVRSVAQALGCVAGAQLALAVLPPAWAKDLPSLALGLRPGVGLLGGAACEFVLGALLTFVVLWCETLSSSVAKLWAPLLATVVAVKAGEDVSGPSLNPAFTLAWAFLYQKTQSPLEYCVVYLAAPVAAGLFGGWAFMGWQQWDAQRRRQQRRVRAKDD